MTEIVLLPVAWTKGTEFRRGAAAPGAGDHLLRPLRHDVRSRARATTLRFEDGPGAVVEVDIDAVGRGGVGAGHRPRPAGPVLHRVPRRRSGPATSEASARCSTAATSIPAIGEWTVPCFVDAYEERTLVRLAHVGRRQPRGPVALRPRAVGGRTRLRFSYVDRARPVRHDDGDRRQPRQGGARAAPPARRGAGQHAAHRGRHQGARRGRVGDAARRASPRCRSRPAGVELVRQAERLGVDSVWVPEFWAADALTPLAYLAAQTSTIRLGTGIVQLGARTPAMLAMSAQSLQALSGGRFVLGIGTSGPQVMEGWHGVRFDRPVRRTRETIEIVRDDHAPASGWSTTARSTSCRCRAARAGRSAR